MPNLHQKGKAITELFEVPESRVRGTHQFRHLESGNRRLRRAGAEGAQHKLSREPQRNLGVSQAKNEGSRSSEIESTNRS